VESLKLKVQSSKLKLKKLPAISYQLLAIFIIMFFFACKGKETPKPAVTPPPSQAIKTAPAEVEKKAATPADIKPNQPPRVEYIDVTPLYPKIGDTLKVTVKASDPDGDEVKLIFQWFKNEELLSETSDSLVLSKENFKRGDNISLNVIPDDGKAKGSSGAMKVTVGNSPPEITSSPGKTKLENREFTYQVKATDFENDPLTFSLKTAPNGMKIDASTGLIKWDVPANFRGKVSVTVIVKDDHGGEAVQSFALEITAEK